MLFCGRMLRELGTALRYALLGCAFASCVGVPGARWDQQRTTHVEVRYALSQLDEDKYEPVEELTGGGIYFENGGFEFGISEQREQALAPGFPDPMNMGMPGPDERIRSELTEFSVGYRKNFFEDAETQPFIGIGIAHLRAQFRRVGATEAFLIDENGFGAYAQIGVRHTTSNYITIDAGVRGVFASERFDLGPVESNFDYAQAYVAIGAWF